MTCLFHQKNYKVSYFINYDYFYYTIFVNNHYIALNINSIIYNLVLDDNKYNDQCNISLKSNWSPSPKKFKCEIFIYYFALLFFIYFVLLNNKF